MGAGGITITKAQTIIVQWDIFLASYQKLLIECCEEDGLCSCKNAMANIQKMPDTRIHFTFELLEILKRIYQECDTPYLYQDNIIVAYGDTNSCTMNNLSMALTNTCQGFDVETWT
jgi:hypothetical protein